MRDGTGDVNNDIAWNIIWAYHKRLGGVVRRVAVGLAAAGLNGRWRWIFIVKDGNSGRD